MSTGDVGHDKPKAKVSPTRNIISTVLLIVFASVAGLEFWGNYRFNKAVKAIEARLPKESNDPNAKFIELPSREEAEKLIGKEADGPVVKEGSDQKVTYTFRGAIRKHVLTAYYQGINKPSLVRISTE